MDNDREIIRRLASQYIEAASDPVNEIRRAGWRRVNDVERNVRPMVWNNEEPWEELNFNGSLTLQCHEPYLREVEEYLRKTIFRWTYFQTDMIIDPFLIVRKVTNFDEWCGMTIHEEIIGDKADGGVVFHDYITQFKTVEDIEKIKMNKIVYDTEETERRFNLLQDCCGDILTIRLDGQGFIHFTPWDKIAMWYNPMEILMDLMLKPELMYAIFRQEPASGTRNMG